MIGVLSGVVYMLVFVGVLAYVIKKNMPPPGGYV